MAISISPLGEEPSRNCCSSLCSKANGCLGRTSNVIIGGLEHAFYNYGKAIARFPLLFIFLCLLLTGICSIGMVNFTTEERPFKLWIPSDSEFIEVLEWKEENFPSDVRFNMAIYEAENVLDKDVILEMLDIHDAVARIQVGHANWSRVCMKVPTITSAFFGRKKRNAIKVQNETFENCTRRKRQANSGIDFSTFLPRTVFCGFLESMKEECLENSLLEVFGYDREYIESLTQEEILDDINFQDTSAVFGFPTNFSSYLGKIERDADGNIVKAQSAIHRWFLKINRTAIANGSFVIDPGSSAQIDAGTYEWEQKFVDTLLNNSGRPEGLSFHLMASTSFGTVSRNFIQNDTKYLAVGFGIVFVYILLMVGKFNMVEQRPILSLLGLSCVGLAIGVSYGLCSAFSVPYGPVNNILPFLLLGLGVDDMFVVMQAWNNLSPKDQKENLQERIGLTLKHAGVSITVTSVTDFVAFAIGSTTLLPALRNFCIYAAIGIASIYFFQATFFVAFLSLDQRRLEDHRHGLLWCWKIKNWKPNDCSQREFCQTFFVKFYSKLLLKLPVKIIIILITVCLLAVSGWGLSNLRQEFRSEWFLPKDSYLYEFLQKQAEYYPSSGAIGTIFFGDIDMVSDMPKLDRLLTELEESDYISEVDSWYAKYKNYWVKQGNVVPNPNTTEDQFLDKLSQFLHSPSGSSYRMKSFRFSGILNCTDKAPAILASSIDYKHVPLSASKEKVNAMDSIREMVASFNFSGYVKPWSRIYAEWETDKVIVQELYRNMGLALIVVFIVTLILIASLPTSLMVLLCVVMTLVDVGALMHWWGLTIDTVSCIDLVLAIGLCVDYAAHVGHTFMTKVGTRDERALQTLSTIGTAVLSGGFSTFLSFVFLSYSGSHVFLTFFKVFFAVCLYGLFHGLVFLPVLLSLLGPAPYATATASLQRDQSPSRPSTGATEYSRQTKDGFVEKVLINDHSSFNGNSDVEKLTDNVAGDTGNNAADVGSTDREQPLGIRMESFK